MRWLYAMAVAVGCVVGLTACTSSGVRGGRFAAGSFDAFGYRHPYLDYRVAFGADGRVLPADWRLDNYRSRSELKNGPSYVVRRWMDLTGDGRPDDLGVQPAYDLRFISGVHGGVIWTRVIPLPPGLGARELRAMMSDLIARMSGTGVASVDMGDVVVAQAQTFATREVDSRVRVVDGREAFEATIEIANVAQLQLSPDARWERARVLLVRADFLTPARGSASQIDRSLLPALIMVGYANRPEDFERAVPDYESLVSRLRLDTPEGRLAAERVTPCAPTAGVIPFVWGTNAGARRVRGPTLSREVEVCMQRALADSDLPTQRSYGLRHSALRFREPPVTPPARPTLIVVPASETPDAPVAADSATVGSVTADTGPADAGPADGGPAAAGDVPPPPAP